MKPDTNLGPGIVVQLAPTTRNKMFAYCFMVIVEPREFGAMGYVQSLGKDGKSGSQAYYRAKWDEMELVGVAEWVAK